jgi:4-alpha-glucanotransferase
MTDALHRLAEAAGLEIHWDNYLGEPRTVQPDALRAVLTALGYHCGTAAQIRESLARLAPAEGLDALPPLITARVGAPIRLPADNQAAKLLLEPGTALDIALQDNTLAPVCDPGYHRLLIGDREIVLAMAPEHAPRVGRRVWGIATQVYGLRRPGDGGIGDTAAVAEFAEAAADRGADLLALSPMHALFAARPDHYGPYSPSSRLFLNPLLASPELVLGRGAVAAAGLAEEFARLEQAELIDWPRSTEAKMRLFRILFTRLFLDADAPEAMRSEYLQFEAESGPLLAGHACFEALQAEQLALNPLAVDWRHWPADLRDPESPAVAAFAQAHHHDVSFHVFLQWIAERSLAAAQHRARRAGMAIGLIADMAVGMDPAGSHAWSRQSDILSGLTIGAPPDLYNANGQQWGITTFSPAALRTTGYAPFIATLRACLRNAGGIRIDHAMGLRRLWLVPEGASPGDGAYLRYPLTHLLRLLALEAERHRAVVVGEDLGTVPGGFRDALEAHGVSGMRVLWFEKDGYRFIPPDRWTRGAMSMTTTHDLPTVAAWWTGADIALRAEHGVLSENQRREDLEQERAGAREALWAAFCDAGVAEGDNPDGPAAFVDAAVRFVARTNSEIALLPLEDILGQEEQPNLPGTIDQHPNWRRRYPQPVDQVLNSTAVNRRVAAIVDERPPSPGALRVPASPAQRER